MAVIGTRFGMASFPAGIAILASAPIAAALSDVERGEFLGAQIWTGVVYAAAAVSLILPMVYIERKKKRAQG